MNEIIREKLREINRFRLAAIVIFLAGVAGMVIGAIRYSETATRFPSSTSGPGLITLNPTYHPHETEGIIVWIIGQILLIIGISGIYYYTRRHGEILQSMND